MPLKTNEALREQKIIGFAVEVRYAFSELDCRRNLNTPRTARKKKTYSNIPGICQFFENLQTGCEPTVEFYQSVEGPTEDEKDCR